MIEGFQAVVHGIGFIFGTPRMWPLAAVPMAVLTVLICLLGIGGSWAAHEATFSIFGEPEDTWGWLGGWALYVMLILVAWFLAFLLAIILAQPLSGFALEAICLAQERALTGRAPVPPTLAASMLAALKVSLVTLVVGGFFYTGLFLVDFVLPPAVIVTIPLKFLVGAWLIAWNFLDYPLTLHGLGLGARGHWVASHFLEFTIFGTVWATLLLIPGSFLLVLPMGVAGATYLVVRFDSPRYGSRYRA